MIITDRVPIYLGDGSGLAISLEYDSDDPLIVTLVFDGDEFSVDDGDDEIADTRGRWEIGRELLVDGLSGEAGHGRVRITRGRVGIWFDLCGQWDGHEEVLRFAVSPVRLARFLKATLRAVPFHAEAEVLDIDGLIGQLLDVV